MKPNDLSLLVHFDALMQTANVSQAAQLVGIGQPAMSGALARLRQVLGDPLLLRAGHAMVPTPRAQELHRRIAPMLAAWRQMTEDRKAFVAQEAARSYTLLATDYAQFLLLPPLMKTLSELGRGIKLTVLPTNPIKSLQLLETNQVELAIGHVETPPPSLRTRALFTEEAVCVLRGDHPALQEPWNLTAYASLDHLKVMSGSAGTFATALAQSLRACDVDIRVQCTVSSYLAAPHIVRTSDMVGTLPRTIAEAFAPSLGLAILPLPLTVRPINVALYWHGRHHMDPAHRWMRDQIGATFAQVAVSQSFAAAQHLWQGGAPQAKDEGITATGTAVRDLAPLADHGDRERRIRLHRKSTLRQLPGGRSVGAS